MLDSSLETAPLGHETNQRGPVRRMGGPLLKGKTFVGGQWFWGLSVLLSLHVSSALFGQEPYLFRIGLTGGTGAALDAQGNASFEAQALQVALGMVTNERTQVSARFGRIDFDRPIEGLSKAQLHYALVGGEYRFSQGFYDFGITLGLGGYELEGREMGTSRRFSAIGLGLALLGDFDISQRLALTAEANLHYAFFDRSPQLFAAGLVGVAFRF